MYGFLVPYFGIAVFFFIVIYMIFVVLILKNNSKKVIKIDQPDILYTQQDTRDIETRKRVRKQIEAQWESLNARALVPHGPQCKDPLTCTDPNCWKFIPDRIVENNKD